MYIKSVVVEYYFSNGVLFAFLQKNVSLNLCTVKAMIEKQDSLSLNERVPLIIITNGKHTMNKEGRELMESPEFTNRFTSIAIFCNNNFANFIFTFFSRIQKSKVLVEVFNSKKEAEKWSLNYLVTTQCCE